MDPIRRYETYVRYRYLGHTAADKFRHCEDLLQKPWEKKENGWQRETGRTKAGVFANVVFPPRVGRYLFVDDSRNRDERKTRNADSISKRAPSKLSDEERFDCAQVKVTRTRAIRVMQHAFPGPVNG